MQEGQTSIRVTLRQPTAIPKSRRRHLSDLAPFCAVQRPRGSPLHGSCLGAVIKGNSAVCRTVLREVLWLFGLPLLALMVSLICGLVLIDWVLGVDRPRIIDYILHPISTCSTHRTGRIEL